MMREGKVRYYLWPSGTSKCKDQNMIVVGASSHLNRSCPIVHGLRKGRPSVTFFFDITLSHISQKNVDVCQPFPAYHGVLPAQFGRSSNALIYLKQ